MTNAYNSQYKLPTQKTSPLILLSVPAVISVFVPHSNKQAFTNFWLKWNYETTHVKLLYLYLIACLLSMIGNVVVIRGTSLRYSPDFSGMQKYSHPCFSLEAMNEIIQWSQFFQTITKFQDCGLVQCFLYKVRNCAVPPAGPDLTDARP